MEKVKLGDVCEIINGYAFKSNLYEENGIRIIRITNVQKGYIEDTEPKFYNLNLKRELNKYMLYEKDLLISLTGNVGRVGILKKEMLPAALNQRVGCIRVLNKSRLDKNYLFNVLNNKLFENECINNSKGIAQKNLSTEWLKEYKINLPSLEEQKNIANKLDKVQKIIDIRKKQIEELDKLIKSQFVEMFDLENYKEKSLRETSNFIDYRGHTPVVSETGNIRMINAKSVGKGYFKYIDEYITEELYNEWMHRGFAYAGDVLFVTEGHTFGNTCLIPDDIEKFGLGQRVITIQSKSELNNIYLCYYMQLDEFINKINMYKTGGTAQGIRSKDLLKITIPIAPIELQNKFAKIYKQIDKQKLEIQKSLKEMEELKESLMNKYFK